jgi:glycosyltransferase involved in cell wall biosynthesis
VRYYWSSYDEYLKNPGFGFLNPFVRLVMPSMVKKLKRWDYAAAQRPDFMIANSKEVSSRIKRYYNRKSEIINPPVNIERFSKVKISHEDYYLVVSRFVPYKRIDLAIKACNDLERKLIVAGRGPEIKNLKKLASKNITFIEDPTDKKIDSLYAGAKAFIFSAEEDFGITPVEAMAAGVPVICFGKAGATETVINGKTGLYHDKQSVQSLKDAIEKFETMQFDTKLIKSRAKDFSEDRFLSALGGFISEKLKK